MCGSIPIGFSVVLSFYKWNLISPLKPFVGLDNYTQLMSDDNFLLALKNTTDLFAVDRAASAPCWRLPLAVFLAGARRLSAFYQTVYFLPVITPMVPMAIAWKWIYDYNYGILNYGLSLVGMPSVPWLTDPTIALWALVIMGVWKVLGYNLVLFLVGIRNIPAEYLEAASLDGATAWQRFRHVTLPLLKPILLYVLVTSTINAYNVFTQVYVMTLGSQAAPGQAVRMLVFDIYQNGFQYFRMGYASAEAVALTMIVLGFTLIQFRLVRNAPAQALRRWAPTRIARSGPAWGWPGPCRPDGSARVLMVLPMLWMLATSFKPRGRDRRSGRRIPAAGADAATTTPASSRRRRSPASSSTASASRWSSTLCGHADLAGRRRRLRQIPLPRPPRCCSPLIIATAIVPFESYMIPLYLQLNAIDWINTYQGIVLPYLFMAFGIFLMRQHVASAIPTELLEAARVDGASEWWILRRVIAPLSGNALAAVGIFAFIQAWGAFIWPLLIANDQKLFNMELGLTAFQFRSAATTAS